MAPPAPANLDAATVAGFGDEWARFDQSELSDDERACIFDDYFRIFPWATLPENPKGFDLGCGSGRWAALVAPRVGTLVCVDPAPEALAVAKRNLAGLPGVRFAQATATTLPLDDESQDFGYSLGVLHHVPDTAAALSACVRKLKRGAPFLLYLYYAFDDRPPWFRMVWKLSDAGRRVICRLPPAPRQWTTDAIAASVYFPLAKASALLEARGIDVSNIPLSYYRKASFYTMRTDARDRFGTALEQRFTRAEIAEMMERAGLTELQFSPSAPYWVAVGRRA